VRVADEGERVTTRSENGFKELDLIEQRDLAVRVPVGTFS
jgi:hypothetical protein